MCDDGGSDIAIGFFQPNFIFGSDDDGDILIITGDESIFAIDTDVLGRMGLAEAYMRLERFDDSVAQLKMVVEAGKEKVGENYDVALCGLDAVKAILCCRAGDYDTFKELFLHLFNCASTWLTVVYDMLPFLNGEDWFLDFLQNIKK